MNRFTIDVVKAMYFIFLTRTAESSSSIVSNIINIPIIGTISKRDNNMYNSKN